MPKAGTPVGKWPMDAGITITMRRTGGEECIRTFEVGDAVLMGKWNQNPKMPWSTAPKVMLRQKACTQAARALFPDVLLGLYTIDEIEPTAMRSITGETLESRRAAMEDEVRGIVEEES